MNIDKFNKVNTLSKIIFELGEGVEFNDMDTISKIPNTAEIRKRLEQVEIIYYGYKDLSVDIGKIGIKVFFNEEHFHNTTLDLIDFDADFAILVVVKDDFNNFQYYSAEKKMVLTANTEKNANQQPLYTAVRNHFLVENTKYYKKLLNVLRSPKIADYDNETMQEIIIFDEEKGIGKLKYDTNPLSKFSVSIEKRCKRLFEAIEKLDFFGYFKKELIEFSKTTPAKVMMKKLIDKLEVLTSNAERSRVLHVSDFSYKKFKNELQKEKLKYLNSLRDVLGKIFSQVIAIPLSISASALAAYEVKSNLILTLILVAVAVYSFFVMHIQLIYLREVREIEEDIEGDFSKIKLDSGLTKDVINNELKKIQTKLKIVRTTIWIFIGAIITLTLFFIYFIYDQNLISRSIIIILVLTYIVLILIRRYIVYLLLDVLNKKKDAKDKKVEEDGEDKEEKKDK